MNNIEKIVSFLKKDNDSIVISNNGNDTYIVWDTPEGRYLVAVTEKGKLYFPTSKTWGYKNPLLIWFNRDDVIDIKKLFELFERR